jgi:hypothetical protein
MDANFLKAQAERCRDLAKNADEFTKRRLFVLAVNYEKRLRDAAIVAKKPNLDGPLSSDDAPRVRPSLSAR